MKWTSEKLIALALNYEWQSDFKKENDSAYQTIVKRGMLGVACGHLKKGSKKTWTKHTCQQEALKYKIRKRFAEGSGGAYNAANRNGWLDEVCSHMESGINYLTFEQVKVKALMYIKMSAFRKYCLAEYKVAYKKGWLLEICEHMPKPYESWDFEKVKNIALRYNNRKSFLENDSKAYWIARHNSWTDDVREHMAYLSTGFNDDMAGYLYFVEINNGEAYKIGITNRSVEARFYEESELEIKTLGLWRYANGNVARKKERKILNHFKKFKLKNSKLLMGNGNSELFSKNISSELGAFV